MKAQRVYLTVFMFSIGLSFLLLAGCTKTAAVKEEAPVEKKGVAETQAPMTSQPSQVAKTEVAAKEKVKTEQHAEEESAKVGKEASRFSDIHFDFDRYDLKHDDEKILDMHAKWLTKHAKYFIRIEGNCDERGSVEYNLALGQRRAEEAMRYLVNLGIDKHRISTVSYGKERPLDPGHNEEAWAKNRRDHFVVTLNN
jgi:peptidoglycan-associated lipoprotein